MMAISLMAIGSFLNFLAVIKNKWKMPVISGKYHKYFKEKDGPYHKSFATERYIKLPILVDRIKIKIPNKKKVYLMHISIGDVLIVIGFISLFIFSFS